jgi:hypothetical protein
MPDEVPVPVPIPDSNWAKAKKWAKAMWNLNKRAYALWLAACVGVMVHNCTNEPGDDDKPFPIPPVPDWVRPPDGWFVPTPEETDRTLRSLAFARYEDTEAGQAVIVGDEDYPVWRLAAKGRGSIIPVRDQGPVGSCVSFGFADAGEQTAAAQVALAKQRQELPDFVQELIYGGSRINADPRNPIRNGDGSTGERAAKWLESVGGYLQRGQYGSRDFTSYSVELCRQIGNSGVSADLVIECKKHSAKCTLVDSAEKAKSALSQGYAIAVCSDQGFASTRDAQGFAKAQGQWMHCMSIVGFRKDRAGFLIKNSWGARWINGPKGTFEDIPDGSFWAEASVVDRMLRQKDSYAVANAEGFKRRKIRPDDWVVTVQKNERWNDVFAFALAP